jgi:hypothetical protein
MNHRHPPTRLRRRSLLSAIATAATPAAARQALASIEVFDRDSGQVLPTYSHDGRRFVPGRPGARYAVRLRNLTTARVLIVLSIDGVNAITGETADWRQSGYVLDPGASYDINGWRKSSTEVAAFVFAPIERSYAAQTGRPGNVGVIGMAAFRERPAPVPSPALSMPAGPPIAARAESRRQDAAESGAAGGAQLAGSAKSAVENAAGARLGTGHGQRARGLVTGPGGRTRIRQPRTPARRRCHCRALCGRQAAAIPAQSSRLCARPAAALASAA